MDCGSALLPTMENNCCLKGPISKVNNSKSLGKDSRATALSVGILARLSFVTDQEFDWADALKAIMPSTRKVSKSLEVVFIFVRAR